MGVPIHGQRDGRVAGEHLSDFGRDVGGDEVGDESVPQRVKIGFAPARVGGKQEAGLLAIGPFLWILRLIDPRHSGRLEIVTQHSGGLAIPFARPESLGWTAAGRLVDSPTQEVLEVFRQRSLER